eukprot:NODE_14976_length_1075_cov_3.722574.p1 GENE.NODE_14976_length_1075_cov_3.722574~~NODE_14976_length_1075_cov_3.722574.p1  ORF type:complete len:266 (-),score=68.48 NODE_14976_length_1075_cov_3.722574:119-916(-)
MPAAPACSLPLEVTCSDYAKVSLERFAGGDDVPVLGLNLSVKIPLRQLVSALLDFQAKATVGEPPPGLQVAPRLPQQPNEGVAPAASTDTAAGDNGAVASASAAAASLVAVTAATSEDLASNEAALSWNKPIKDSEAALSWNKPIKDLDPSDTHKEYLKRTMWKAAQLPNTIGPLNLSLLRNFVPRPLDPPPMIQVMPGGLHSNPALPRTGADSAAVRLGGEGAAPGHEFMQDDDGQSQLIPGAASELCVERINAHTSSILEQLN